MYYLINGYSFFILSVLFLFFVIVFNFIYLLYIEVECCVYRLDEVLLWQSMNNFFMKWYYNGVLNGIYFIQNGGCNMGMYNNMFVQWQGYGDQFLQIVYYLFLFW